MHNGAAPRAFDFRPRDCTPPPRSPGTRPWDGAQEWFCPLSPGFDSHLIPTRGLLASSRHSPVSADPRRSAAHPAPFRPDNRSVWCAVGRRSFAALVFLAAGETQGSGTTARAAPWVALIGWDVRRRRSRQHGTERSSRRHRTVRRVPITAAVVCLRSATVGRH